ncbi:MAG: hypothetical protein QOJ25_1079, partial [Solirubrobacteraceae bacterium]|nr:hypothetical protein [Solirubrobacteraceae bacterium]
MCLTGGSTEGVGCVAVPLPVLVGVDDEPAEEAGLAGTAAAGVEGTEALVEGAGVAGAEAGGAGAAGCGAIARMMGPVWVSALELASEPMTTPK